jgi:hypothetical protein
MNSSPFRDEEVNQRCATRRFFTATSCEKFSHRILVVEEINSERARENPWKTGRFKSFGQLAHPLGNRDAKRDC